MSTVVFLVAMSSPKVETICSSDTLIVRLSPHGVATQKTNIKKKYFVVPLTSSVAIHEKQNGEEMSVSRNNIIATIMSLFQLLLKKRRRNISRCCQRNMTELKGDQECRNISLFHGRKDANRVLGQQNQTP
jgi:hypothetical protein